MSEPYPISNLVSNFIFNYCHYRCKMLNDSVQIERRLSPSHKFSKLRVNKIALINTGTRSNLWTSKETILFRVICFTSFYVFSLTFLGYMLLAHALDMWKSLEECPSDMIWTCNPRVGILAPYLYTKTPSQTRLSILLRYIFIYRFLKLIGVFKDLLIIAFLLAGFLHHKI